MTHICPKDRGLSAQRNVLVKRHSVALAVMKRLQLNQINNHATPPFPRKWQLKVTNKIPHALIVKTLQFQALKSPINLSR